MKVMEEISLLYNVILSVVVVVIGWIMKRHGDTIKTISAEINKILEDGIITSEELQRIINLVLEEKNKKEK